MRKLISHGGEGSEANIDVELRTEFPGIGGKITTAQAVMTALRKEFCANDKLGHRMFLRHMIIKKLDDLFLRKGFYQFPHIPRPLGSISKQQGEKKEKKLRPIFMNGSLAPKNFHGNTPTRKAGLLFYIWTTGKNFARHSILPALTWEPIARMPTTAASPKISSINSAKLITA